MIGVRVSLLVIVVGHNDLRLGATNHGHESPGGLVGVGLVEALGMFVRLGLSHPGVAVSEHHDFVETDHRSRRGKFGRPHRGNQRPFLFWCQFMEWLTGFTQRWILEVALLASRAAHENRVHAVSVILRKRRCTFRGLVIRVGVHGKDRARFSHVPRLSVGDV